MTIKWGKMVKILRVEGDKVVTEPELIRKEIEKYMSPIGNEDREGETEGDKGQDKWIDNQVHGAIPEPVWAETGDEMMVF